MAKKQKNKEVYIGIFKTCNKYSKGFCEYWNRTLEVDHTCNSCPKYQKR